MRSSGLLMLAAMCCLLAYGSGCASIIKGGSQDCTITSEPSGAKATIFDKENNAIHNGTTPMTVSLKRGSGYWFGPAKYRIVMEKPGFARTEGELSGQIGGWYFGNLLFGGLIGMVIVDPLTGAMWSLAPEPLHVVLNPAKAGDSPPERLAGVPATRPAFNARN